MTTTTTEVATLNMVTPQPSIVLNIGNREVVRINPDGTVWVNHHGTYTVDRISKEFLSALASSRVPMPNDQAAKHAAELQAANERIARLRKALAEIVPHVAATWPSRGQNAHFVPFMPSMHYAESVTY